MDKVNQLLDLFNYTLVAALFKTTKPMIDYINRAVDYAREEM